MRTKVLVVVVALILGGLAAVLTARYLAGARADLDAQSKPVEVLVAQQDIPRGVSAEDLVAKKLVAREEVPARFVAAGAISSARAIEGQVLAVPVSSGEQLTTGRFQFPSEAGLAYNVPEDYVALTVPVDAVSGLGGYLKAGDNVAVYATVKTVPDDEASIRTRLIIDSARVLAAGAPQAEPGTEGSEQQGSGGVMGQLASGQGGAVSEVTLALSPADAEKLVFVASKGEGGATRSVWLALLPVKSTGAASTKGQSYSSVLK